MLPVAGCVPAAGAGMSPLGASAGGIWGAIPDCDQVCAFLNLLLFFSGVSKWFWFVSPRLGTVALSHCPCLHAVPVTRGCGAGQGWGQQTPASGPQCAVRGSQGVWALGQWHSLQPELCEGFAISSLLFLPLASSAERFTSSLCEDRRGENV